MRKGDVFIAQALLALAGILMLFRLLPGGIGTVYVNGEPAVESMTVNEVEIKIEDNRARIVASPCRDKLCVHAGWLEKPGEVAACLPQRVVVEIRSATRGMACVLGSGVDGVAY